MEYNKLFTQIQNSKHWDEQLQLLHTLPIHESTIPVFNQFKNTQIILSLLSNPRSKVITSTVQYCVQLLERHGPNLHSFALHLIQKNCLFKLLNSSNKLIASSAHELLKSILINAPHQKLYSILLTQFSSKNPFVRQQISTYFLVLIDTIICPSKFVSQIQKWSDDPNRNVRNNIKIILQYTKNESKKSRSKTRSVLKQKHSNTKNNKSNTMQKCTKSKRQDIVNSFVNENNENNEFEDNQTTNIQFLIDKINSDEAWNVKHIAIQQLLHLARKPIQKYAFRGVFEIVVSLLNEKRSKVYHQAYQTLKYLLTNQLSYCLVMDNMEKIVLKALKVQTIAIQLLPQLLRIDAIRNIVSFCQYSMQVKPIREKVILLDVIAQALSEQLNIQESKVGIVTKLVCKHIQRYYNNKDIYLPCLAIISHFKLTFPQTLLGCLLCQDYQILNKIINIAEEIDPQLRDGIIQYIHKMKGIHKNKKNITNNTNTSMNNDPHLHTIKQLINQINQDEQSQVSELARFIFINHPKLNTHHFVEVIKLSQTLVNENQLLDLELFLQELCKTQSYSYLQALFKSIQMCDEKTVQSEYMIVYLQKILTILSLSNQYKNQKLIQRLISLYRISKNPKVRKSCIKILCTFQHQTLKQLLNEKELQLVMFYQNSDYQSKTNTSEDFTSLTHLMFTK